MSLGHLDLRLSLLLSTLKQNEPQVLPIFLMASGIIRNVFGQNHFYFLFSPLFLMTVYNIFEISSIIIEKASHLRQKDQSFDNILRNLRIIKLTKKIDYIFILTPSTPAFKRN